MSKKRAGAPTPEEISPQEKEESDKEPSEKEKFEERELKESFEVPDRIKDVLAELQREGQEAYLVGGCVRDQFTGHEQHDWDMTSNADPEEVEGLFPTTYAENEYGTVTIVDEDEPIGSPLRDVEVTPYRTEEDYSDKRHPDKVEFADDISEDLSRRDFTINAMAVRVDQSGNSYIVDAYGGKQDIEEGVIRAVGEAEERFDEDALRIIRGVRFSSKLDFEIEEDTRKAIESKKQLLDKIANERIREETLKMLEAKNPEKGVKLLEDLELLKYLASEPEQALEESDYELVENATDQLKYASENRLNEEVKEAVLFSSIEEKGEDEGEEERTEKLMKTLKFPNEEIDKVKDLVQYYDFEYENKKDKKKLAKKIMKKVGRTRAHNIVDLRETIEKSRDSKFNISDLVKIRKRIEQSRNEPLEVEDLEVNGGEITEETDLEEGPVIGKVLNVLTYKVFQNPRENEKEKLLTEAQKLANLGKEKLQQKFEEAKQEMEEIETKEIQ